ncbi:hypothetical protein QFC21_001981 [Naganishia friedmannii]|uniref:Uncharacterized protein n=1 Tax=Naganishia friedmannii TaxID=89922 RepID=A0ACC2VYB9_9TREE|nr:hypothetical protein QFC21_001981 [Naganishia friedmannii]
MWGYMQCVATHGNEDVSGRITDATSKAATVITGGNKPGPPSPITPTDSSAFEVFAKAVQAAFGEDVVIAPISMTGNTDTRHYVNL